MPGVVIDFLKQLPIDSVILLRSGNSTRPGRFERIVAQCCMELWMSYRWVKPEGDGGRGSTFDRDVSMVGASDVVLAFFAEESMSGGTEHVVEKAIDQRVPVYSYGVVDGELIRIGENDPNESWARLAPAI